MSFNFGLPALVNIFFCRPTGRLPIHGDASAKATLYRDRFLLLLQRLSRDPSFTKPAFDTEVSRFGSCEVLPPHINIDTY